MAKLPGSAPSCSGLFWGFESNILKDAIHYTVGYNDFDFFLQNWSESQAVDGYGTKLNWNAEEMSLKNE